MATTTTTTPFHTKAPFNVISPQSPQLQHPPPAQPVPLFSNHSRQPLVARTNLNQFRYSSKDNNNFQTSNLTTGKLSTEVLPYDHRCVFPFKEFNDMQSKSFHTVYNSLSNCVVSSPTGSGKTVLFELAILRELSNCPSEPDFKVLYLAPTKALCNEKLEDWNKKFAQLNVTVGILTGDSTFKEAENVRKSTIIISTPEKWDMITRKWKDYSKLFGLIKLLLVDEIHILKDLRGSTLEVVVTRMKRICIGLRILAISATVANAGDISKWIKLADESTLPAETLCFGEEYRAVKLFKIVYGYKPTSENDFQFDIHLNSKLIEVINTHSKGKPVLIFCPTRNSSQGTAKFLYNNMTGIASDVQLKLKDHDDATYATKGIAYHHAGLHYADRKQIENSFLNGGLKVLCSTSTLAVGINLPAYLVIIKGTKCWAENCFQEYSETDILQMVGRAGRPQFEREGVAVIMTSAKLKQKYERLVKGTEKVESSLHLNFAEHLAAEIAVGVIKNIEDALIWLQTTYLYVRFMSNPSYYVLQIPKSSDLKETLTDFCRKQADSLYQEKIIFMDDLYNYKISPYGYSMTMHYVSFETMTKMIQSGLNLSISEILDVITKSKEFSDLKLKQQEKRLYREINNSPILRYPSKLKELSHCDKVSCIIQFELGGLEFPTYNGAMKLHSSFLGDKFYVFKHIYRLMMALLEVCVEKKDAVSLRSVNYLLRCINGRCWEDSPNELRQLDGVGPASVKKFCNHNVLSLEDARSLTNTQLEYYLGLKTGGGSKIKKNIQSLPQLCLDFVFDDEELSDNRDEVVVTTTVTIDVTNAKLSSNWKNRLVYIHIITDTSDGELLDFRRIPVCKFKNSGPKSYQVMAKVKNLNMTIHCQASADCIASVKSNSSVSIHPHLSQDTVNRFIHIIDDEPTTTMSTIDYVGHVTAISDDDNDDDDDIKKLFEADHKPTSNVLKLDIIDLENDLASEKNHDLELPATQSKVQESTTHQRKTLPNGNYECNHACKDKLKCRHLCCREGLPVKSIKRKHTETKDNSPVLDTIKDLNHADNKVEVVLNEVREVVKPKVLNTKPLRLKKTKAVFKRTLFDDSDPEEMDSIQEIIQEVLKKKYKKTTSKVFSIENVGDHRGESRQEEVNSEVAAILDKSIFDYTTCLGDANQENDSLYNHQEEVTVPVKENLADTKMYHQSEYKEENQLNHTYNKDMLQGILGLDLELDL